MIISVCPPIFFIYSSNHTYDGKYSRALGEIKGQTLYAREDNQFYLFYQNDKWQIDAILPDEKVSVLLDGLSVDSDIDNGSGKLNNESKCPPGKIKLDETEWTILTEPRRAYDYAYENKMNKTFELKCEPDSYLAYSIRSFFMGKTEHRKKTKEKIQNQKIGKTIASKFHETIMTLRKNRKNS